MPRNFIHHSLAAIAIAGVLVAPAVLAHGNHDKTHAEEKKTEKAKLTKVENKKVCMINEAAFEKDQIPVVVDGKIYYGCCEMCKNALTNDASRRVATDPLTGEEVDKALAIIGVNSDGNVFYFKSEKNLEAYNASLAGR
ncbi:MAG TPA: hypothetical protein VMT00_13025 [Thermoanaerobaculia bacterium]|nr:hypothetical protein [Thermoanaerobaculia bacterium]